MIWRRAGVFAAGAMVLGASLPALAAVGYTQTVEATPGLLAYYQFNDTNSSVNGYTGTLTTGASIDVAGSGPVSPRGSKSW